MNQQKLNRKMLIETPRFNPSRLGPAQPQAQPLPKAPVNILAHPQGFQQPAKPQGFQQPAQPQDKPANRPPRLLTAKKQTADASPYKKTFNKKPRHYKEQEQQEQPPVFIYGVDALSLSNCFGPEKYDDALTEKHKLTLDNIYTVRASKLFYFISNSQRLDDMENAAKVITNLAKCHWHRTIDYNLDLDTELIKGICSTKRPVKILPNSIPFDVKLSKQSETSFTFDGLKENENIDNNIFYKFYRALVPAIAISSFGSRTTASIHDSSICEADYNFVRFLKIYKEMLVARNKIMNDELKQKRTKLIKDAENKLKQGEINKEEFYHNKVEIETRLGENSFQDPDITLLCSFIYHVFQQVEEKTLNYYLTIALIHLRISSIFLELEKLKVVELKWLHFFDDNDDNYDTEDYDDIIKEIMESNSPIKRILAEIVNNIKLFKNGFITLCEHDQNYRKILLNYLSQELFNKQRLPLIKQTQPPKVEIQKTPEQIRAEKQTKYLSSVRRKLNTIVKCDTTEQLNKYFKLIDDIINNDENKGFDIISFIVDHIFNSIYYDEFSNVWPNPLLKLIRDYKAGSIIRKKWLSIRYSPIARLHLFNWCILTRDLRLVKFMFSMDKKESENRDIKHYGILDNMQLLPKSEFVYQLFETDLYKDSLEFFRKQDSLNKNNQLDLIKEFALRLLNSIKQEPKLCDRYKSNLNDAIKLFESFRPLPQEPLEEEIFEEIEPVETIQETNTNKNQRLEKEPNQKIPINQKFGLPPSPLPQLPDDEAKEEESEKPKPVIYPRGL